MYKYFYNKTHDLYWETTSEVTNLEEYINSLNLGNDEIISVTQRPHCFCNYTDEEWVEDSAAKLENDALVIRGERDYRLVKDLDPVVSNPLRWADLTSEKQAEWAAYRTALLNVPQQEGFPSNVEWPTKPT
jgi:hypothetical protein